jgi:hypothetical protein
VGIPAAQSEIYSIPFDRDARRIGILPEPLAPLFLKDGLALNPAVASDGRKAAFLYSDKGRRGRAKNWLYDIELVNIDGSIEAHIDVSGTAFSRPVFVGETLLVNELFPDHYEVKLLDPETRIVRSIHRLDHSPRQLRRLPTVKLQLHNVAGGQRAQLK